MHEKTNGCNFSCTCRNIFIFQFGIVEKVTNEKNNIWRNFERGPNMTQIIPGPLKLELRKLLNAKKLFHWQAGHKQTLFWSYVVIENSGQNDVYMHWNFEIESFDIDILIWMQFSQCSTIKLALQLVIVNTKSVMSMSFKTTTLFVVKILVNLSHTLVSNL